MDHRSCEVGPYICIYGLGGMYAWGRGHRGMCVYGGYMCMGYGCWGGAMCMCGLGDMGDPYV